MLFSVLLGAAAAAAATLPPLTGSTASFTETFEEGHFTPGTPCYYVDTCYQYFDQPVDQLKWNNMYVKYARSAGGVSPQGLVPYDGFWDAIFTGNGGTTANITTLYTGSKVDHVSLKSFAFGCNAVQTVAFQSYTVNTTWGANCSLTVTGSRAGIPIAFATFNYVANITGIYWPMQLVNTDALFQALPVDTLTFTGRAAAGTHYLSDVTVAIDHVSFTNTNKTF